MAEIPEFTSPVNSLHPTEVGVQALTQSAVRANRSAEELAASTQQTGRMISGNISSTIRDIGKVAENYQDNQDRSKVSTFATSGLADLETQWQQRLKGNGLDPKDPNYIPPADPNDPSVLAGFQKDHVQPFLDKLQSLPSGPAGQRYAQDQSDAIARHLSTQFRADAANLASEGAVLRNTQTLNSLGNLVTTTPTPDNIDFAIKQYKDSVGIAKAGASVTAEGAAKLDAHEQAGTTNLVHAGIVSAVMKAADPPSTAALLLNRYKSYVKPEDGDTVTALATAVVKARAADVKAAAVAQERQQKQQAFQRTDQYVQDQISPNPRMKVTDIMSDPAYAGRPDLRKEAVGVITTMRKLEQQDLTVNPAVSHSTTLSLMSRLTAPEGNPERINDRQPIDQAFIEGTLTRQDYTFLQGQVKAVGAQGGETIAKERDEFFKAYKGTIDPTSADGLSPVSALGHTRIYQMQQDAINQEEALKAKGQDPRSLYDPASPNFIGTPKNLMRYQASIKDAQAYNAGVKKDLQATLEKYAPGAGTMTNPNSAPSGAPMEIANKYLGRSETADHAVLTAFLNSAGGPHLDPTTTAWCARFMNATLAASGMYGSGSDLARSFLKVGQGVNPSEAKPGDIIVFPRGADTIKGHVGFIKAIHGDRVEVLGGNQGNRVSVSSFPLNAALGIRRVGAADVGSTVPGDISPQAENSRAIQQAPVAVRTPEDAAMLKPGTRIRLPDGRLGTVPYPEVPISR